MPQYMYPLLLIVVFVGLLLVSVAVSIYLWLRHLDKVFRTCPACTVRGAGEIKDVVEIERTSEVDYNRDFPRLIVTTHFEDHYACNSCGHAWTRTFHETEVKRYRGSATEI
ncbi:MAG: hypothetical protein KDE56_11665 [Anaerolineales bacterium]|nr:hypothetical protein [Anaerolineales bacterium]